MVDLGSGFPPYHPLVSAQGWDPARVEIGLRNDTYELVKAGYNVHGEQSLLLFCRLLLSRGSCVGWYRSTHGRCGRTNGSERC